MTKTLISLLAILGVLVGATGCNRPVCKNLNPIFDNFLPDANEYKSELARQLANVDKSQLSYWMDTHQEHNGTESILVNIQGAGLCAKMLLLVGDSKKGIEGILKTKGAGYRGAKLQDLKFDVRQDGKSTEFIFQEVSGIVD